MQCQIFKLVWEPVTGVYLDNSHIMVIAGVKKGYPLTSVA